MPLYNLGAAAPSLPDDGMAWIAPSADVIGDTVIGSDVSIWFGVVIRADNTPIMLGRGTNVQDGAVLHSDPGAPLTLGEDVTVGHRAILHGCTVGDRTLIGMGAIVLNGAVIGEDSIVGAGALVTEGKVFPPRSLIIGSPAAVRRTLDDDQIAALRESAAIYVANGRRYAAEIMARVSA